MTWRHRRRLTSGDGKVIHFIPQRGVVHGSTTCHTHDSLEKLIRKVETTDPQSSHLSGHGGSWLDRDGLYTWQQVFRASREPWSEGGAKVRDLVADMKLVTPKPHSRKRRGVWDEQQGDSIEVPRLWEGLPAWRRCKRVISRGPRSIVIAVNLATHGSVDAKQFRWRGTTAIVLADLLEQAGYIVEIRGVRCVKLNSGPEAGEKRIDFTIKDPQTPVNIDVVAAVVSTWFYRTVLLQLNEVYGCRFGHSSPRSIKGRCSDLPGKDAILIEVDEICHKGEAETFVKDCINKLDALESASVAD